MKLSTIVLLRPIVFAMFRLELPSPFNLVIISFYVEFRRFPFGIFWQHTLKKLETRRKLYTEVY